MSFHSCRIVRSLFAFVVLFTCLQLASARERGPRVEVVCPLPPTPVNVAGRQLLVYELHITNFDVVPLTLKSLQVSADRETGAPIKTYSGDDLLPILQQVGMTHDAKSSQTIPPGNRFVLFLWIELEAGKRAPEVLSHRLVFESQTGDKVVDAALHDFPVTVTSASVPVLSSPFDGGVWLAGELANDSSHRRSLAAVDGYVHAPERFAIDWVKIGPNGDSHQGTARNEDWWGYGEPIHAVADGVVTAIVNDLPDNQPRVLPSSVTLDNIAGNYITVRIAPDRYVTYAHLRNGSIKRHVGEQVRRGDVLGSLGNSGNSTGAHLHLQITNGNSVLQSEGIPFVLDKFVYLGPGSEYEPGKHPSIPLERSLPVNNAVVEFPSK